MKNRVTINGTSESAWISDYYPSWLFDRGHPPARATSCLDLWQQYHTTVLSSTRICFIERLLSIFPNRFSSYVIHLFCPRLYKCTAKFKFSNKDSRKYDSKFILTILWIWYAKLRFQKHITFFPTAAIRHFSFDYSSWKYCKWIR